MVADFQREYGLNLGQILEDGSGYGPRMILAMVNRLPLESPTIAEIRGGLQFVGWGVAEYQLASLIDAVRWDTYASARAAGARMSKPEPVERPTAKPKTNRFAQIARQKIAAVREARKDRADGGEPRG